MSRRLAHFGRAREGATAIEFAFVVIPFLFVIGVILEIAFMLATEYTLQNAVQNAGRTIRTGNAVSITGDDFRNEVCSKGAAVKNCATKLGISVQSAPNFAGITNPVLANIGPGVHSFNSGKAGEAVAVIATYDWEFIFPLMPLYSNAASGNVRRLHGMAVFRNEPF